MSHMNAESEPSRRPEDHDARGLNRPMKRNRLLALRTRVVSTFTSGSKSSSKSPKRTWSAQSHASDAATKPEKKTGGKLAAFARGAALRGLLAKARPKRSWKRGTADRPGISRSSSVRNPSISVGRHSVDGQSSYPTPRRSVQHHRRSVRFSWASGDEQWGLARAAAARANTASSMATGGKRSDEPEQMLTTITDETEDSGWVNLDKSAKDPDTATSNSPSIEDEATTAVQLDLGENDQHFSRTRRSGKLVPQFYFQESDTSGEDDIHVANDAGAPETLEPFNHEVPPAVALDEEAVVGQAADMPLLRFGPGEARIVTRDLTAVFTQQEALSRLDALQEGREGNEELHGNRNIDGVWRFAYGEERHREGFRRRRGFGLDGAGSDQEEPSDSDTEFAANRNTLHRNDHQGPHTIQAPMDPYLEDSNSRKRRRSDRVVRDSDDEISDTMRATRNLDDGVRSVQPFATQRPLTDSNLSLYPSVPAGALLMGHLVDRTAMFAGWLQLTTPTLVAIERVRSTKHLLQSQGLEVIRQHPDGVKFGFIYNYTPEFVFFLEKPSALIDNVVFGSHAFIADYEGLIVHPSTKVRGLFLYEYTHDLHPDRRCIAIFLWNGDCDPEKVLRDWLAMWESELKMANLVQMG